MLKKITENVEIHQTLPDTPNLTSEELKKEWDKGNKIIKEKFNELIDSLNDAEVLELKEKINNLSTYSTEEMKTGETWIDGKPIYRKVVKQTVSDINSTVDVDLGTTDVDVFINGRVLVDTDEYTSVVNSQSTSTYYIRNFVFRKTASNNTVTVATNMSGVSGNIYVIVEYTKTTD